MDRNCRFMDSAENLGMFRSDSLAILRPFYDGDHVKQRMEAVRKYIVFIRQNWNKRNEFENTLRKVMEGKHSLDAQMNHCLQLRIDWGDSIESAECYDYSWIELYTSEVGYNQIFKIINSIFRRDDSIFVEESILAAVYMVELINIALYNYILANPERNNFQGTVYRGMSLTGDDFESFRSIIKKPIPGRYISTPLSLISTTYEREIACDFISKVSEEQAKSKPEERLHALLFKIHVIELDPHYLQFYRQKFPTSVVSTICAVKIDRLSEYSDECEVLLRGPFFQVLDCYTNSYTDWPILEMVTVNSNRDHVNAAFLGEEDAAARTLFGAMVTATRHRFALKYCKEKGLTKDAKEYEKLLEDMESKLSKLMID